MTVSASPITERVGNGANEGLLYMASTALAAAQPASETFATTAKGAKQSTTIGRTKEYINWFDTHVAKGRSKIHTEIITVTPELARVLLEHNTENRNIRPAKLAQLKSDMKAGRWQFNGETLKVSKEGLLNDGQHRLQAIIETHKPQKLLIVFGVDRNSRETVDTGATRSVGDQLALSGWPYASTIAGVARMVIGYERMKGENFGRPSEISVSEVLERASGDPLLQECSSYAAANTHKFKGLAPQGVTGFCFYKFSEKRPKEAKTFIDGVKTGANLSETSPIRILREKMMNSPRLTKIQKVEAFIRAWNAWINDEPMTRLSVMSKLPQIEG